VTAEGLSLDEIVARLGGTLAGDGSVRIRRVATLLTAGPGDIAFLTNPKYRRQLAGTKAAAVILDPASADQTSLPRIVSANPYAYFARVSQLLNPSPERAAGCDPSASVRSRVPPSTVIGPHVSVGTGVRLGERVVLYAGCVLGDDVEVGDNSVLYPNVVVYAGCRIGKRAIVHAGAVIGADGFGFAKDGEAWVKIPQTGRVLIGDDVEIGANTTIDRGALEDTVIGDGVKLDNQIQVAHNVRIGEHAAMAGCVGIAGSATIGRGCTIGGGAIILGHLELAPGVHVSGGTMVTKSLGKPGQYTGAYPVQEHEQWLHNAAQLRRLDALAQRVRDLEDKLSQSEKK
jgi:UDP-3-O-[3-hydroxymyristoyl] glucosamine N-acyltransferase